MRRWIYRPVALAIVGLALVAAAPAAHGQGAERSSTGDVLAAAALTAADLPAGLVLDRNRSGMRTAPDGTPTYNVIFMSSGPGESPVMGVANVLAQYADTASGLDSLTERFRTGLRGNRTELPAPGIGDASRAFTVTGSAMSGAMSTSTAFVAVRRQDLVAGVAVASMGGTPQTELALRLAAALDQRLAAAVTPRQ